MSKSRMPTARSAAQRRRAGWGESLRRIADPNGTATRVGSVGALACSALGLLYLYMRQTGRLQRERDRLELEVDRRTAQLTELAQHLQSAREDERGRLARELHDELGALLTAAKLDAARIRARLTPPPPEIDERLTHLSETLNSGIALKRRIIEDLRPSTLTNFGLVTALEILCREFGERTQLDVRCHFEPLSLGPSADLTTYRLVQEALTNIAKYASARRVDVTLAEIGAWASISVADDGVGFDANQRQVSSAHGLIGMRYRVEAAGGTLSVYSTPGRGTAIVGRLPMPPTPVAAPSEGLSEGSGGAG